MMARAARQHMRYFAITRPGLISITFAVSALWLCIGMEKVTVARANLEARHTFEQLRRLREPAMSVPVENPAPRHFGYSRPAIG